MESTINTNRYVPCCMNGHMDYMLNANCEIFYTTTNQNSGNKFYAIAYMGKGKNPAWHYSFKSEERMMEYIEKYVEERKINEISKITRKAEQKKLNSEVKVNVGDLFYTSFGYDQTNINFYKIIEVKGKVATIVEIGSTTVPGSEGFMCCHVRPNPNHIISSPFTKHISADYSGNPTFRISSFEHAILTDKNTSKYRSWYA